MSRHYTSIEQSRKLIELGLPANTADCYHNDIFGKANYSTIEFRQTNKEKAEDFFEQKNYHYPCWSLGQLIDLLMNVKHVEYMHFTFEPTLSPIVYVINKFDVIVNTLGKNLKQEIENYGGLK